MADPTWTFTNGAADAEGSQITVDVTLEADDSALAAPQVDQSKAALTGVSQIHCWRFNQDKGTLRSDANVTANITRTVVYGWAGPTSLGGGRSAITFKLAIDLSGTQLVAIGANAASVSPNLTILPNFVTVVMPGKASITGPSGTSTVAIDTSKVGKLPKHGTGLRVHTDALAAWIESDDAGADPLSPWTDLSGQSTTYDLDGTTTGPELDAADGPNERLPSVAFDDATPERATNASFPTVRDNATIAIVFTPTSPTGSAATLIARFNEISNGKSWRVAYDQSASPDEILYEARVGSSSDTLTWDAPTGKVLFVFTREEDVSSSAWKSWINGLVPTTGTTDNGVNSGAAGPLTVGARMTGSSTWGDGFDGTIDQVAVYSSTITDLEASYILHEMARRAMIDLGTPIPEEFQTLPFTGVDSNALHRRPIAVINLSSGGIHQDNYFGQNPQWRAPTKAEIKSFLRREIQRILVANDQFEIMFNRPGGTFKQDIVPTYIFGTGPNSEQTVTDDQWDALREIWDEFNLGHTNDDTPKVSRLTARRRGWIYTGGGLPLTDQAALDTTGLMHNRSIGPASPAAYYDAILSEWESLDVDGRAYFRCLFLDASQPFRGQFVALCHSDEVRSNDFILVGESITRDPLARLGAPWFGAVGFNRAPWWVLDNLGVPDKDLGYDTSWTSDSSTMPLYCGVFRGAYPYMRPRPSDAPSEWSPGPGDNMTIGTIYRFVQKGASPSAWQNNSVYRRIGAAWDYAMGRITPSRQFRSPRLNRVARV